MSTNVHSGNAANRRLLSVYHSEIIANLLIGLGLNLGNLSEYPLKTHANHLDFDSAILGTCQTASRVRRFEIVRTRS